MPAGYRLVYNVDGDHRFHVLRALAHRPKALRGYGPGFAPPPLTSCTCNEFDGTTNPLLTVTDTNSGDTTAAYLTVIESSLGTDKNTPLEIINQATSSGGAVLPSSPVVPAGFGGIDLVQNTAAASLTSESSPALQFMAQVYTGSASIPDVWYFQNQPASGKNNPQQLFALVHSATNANNNLTFQVPAGVNIAAGTPTDASPQLTVGATPSTNQDDLHLVPVTVVGPSTSKSDSTTKAGVTQIWPGFLLHSPNSAATAQEGSLQIGIALKAGTTTTMGLLACYTAAQTASACTTTSQPMLGVFFSTNGSGDSVVALAPPSRAAITSDSAHGNVQFTAGNPVCRDPNHQSEVIQKSGSSCGIGQTVGVAVGDPSAGTSHVVDLNFSTQAATASGDQSLYVTGDSDLTTGPSGATACMDGSGNMTTTGCGTISNTLLTLYCIGTVTTGATLYMFPGATSTACNSATGSGAMLPITFGGTIKNLGVFYVTPPGAGQTDTFTVLKCPALASCAATGVTCSISGTATPSTCTDNTHTFSVSAGDAIQLTDATGASSAGASPRISIQLQ
ncbi:MAG TPA: hypothetical protein VIX19_04270 [Terriglobales bacterium]